MHLVKKNISTRLTASWGLLQPVGFESGFGFEAVGFGFGFGFKKKRVDSDSAGFGFEVPGFGSGFGFEMPGFAHHWFGDHPEILIFQQEVPYYSEGPTSTTT